MAIFGSASGGAFVGFTPNNKHSLKGDELYFESLLKADEKMAKLDAAAKPDLDSYDKDLGKLKANEGHKAFLHAQYKNVLKGLQKGASQHGGWLRYAQTDEFKEQINKLNDWTYNTTVAEKDYEDMQHIRNTLKPAELDAIYIDGSGEPRVVFDGKKPRYMTNKEYLNKIGGLVQKNGGKLEHLPISINQGDRSNFIEDLNKVAANLGHDKNESLFKIVSGAAKTSSGSVDYVQAGTTTNQNNKKQREAAAFAVLENLSNEGRNGIRRTWIERGKPGDFNQFVVMEAANVLMSRRVNENSNNMGMTKIGSDAKDVFKDENDYITALLGLRDNVTLPPTNLPGQGVGKDGKVGSNHEFIIYPQGKFDPILSKMFPEGKPVTGSFIFKGVLHDEFGGEGRAVKAGDWTYGSVKSVGSRYFKLNKNSMRYDVPVTNEELISKGILSKDLTVQTPYIGQEYKLLPAVNVEIKGKVGKIMDAGGNLNTFVTDENGHTTVEKVMDDGTIAAYAPHFWKDGYLNQAGIRIMENDPNSLNINMDTPEAGFTTRDRQTADITAVVTKPFDIADAYYSPEGISKHLSSNVDLGNSMAVQQYNSQMQLNAKKAAQVYGPSFGQKK